MAPNLRIQEERDLSDPIANGVYMNYRYSAAWQEVNTRIAQRQNALNIFVTLATGIVAIILASRGTAPSQFDPKWFSLLLPLVSIAFGLLNYKHDKTIALLRWYLSEAERMAPPGGAPAATFPGYNSDPRFKKHADSTRRFHDYSCAFLVVFFNFVGFVAALRSFPTIFTITGWPIFIYIASIAISLYFVMRSSVWPHQF